MVLLKCIIVSCIRYYILYMYMYNYYEGERISKTLSALEVGRDAEKLLYCSTHERTHNIYDCECMATSCEAEDRNTRTYRTY